jgi:translation initiation factor IF-2
LAKQLKIKIKNTQIAKKVNLDHLKQKLVKPKEEQVEKAEKPPVVSSMTKEEEEQADQPRKIRAKAKSSFGQEVVSPPPPQEAAPSPAAVVESGPEELIQEELPLPISEEVQPPPPVMESAPKEPSQQSQPIVEKSPPPLKSKREVLGPTGRHISDLLPPKKRPPPPREERPPFRGGETRPPMRSGSGSGPRPPSTQRHGPRYTPPAPDPMSAPLKESETSKREKKTREFRDLKPQKRDAKPFSGRDRGGIDISGEEDRWRKKRTHKQRSVQEEAVIRPTELRIRIPISIKDLSAQMKLKSSELIQKLFMQGIVVTLNDMLEDETTIQFLGEELGCAVTIDTSEEERIQITPKSVLEEIQETESSELMIRPPVVTFMGHVDHGKTSLIDAIRETNRAAGEAGAITQHIGAFKCHTKVGDLTILDTPGHEAFSAMRSRGASTTDIVVLVVAGDEGIREQTKEAIMHAKQAGVTIVVAINKCDKPNFNAESVYRELAEVELLPEAWGGSTITVNTSAITKEGISHLLEMLALQAEVLELKANPKSRARGIVLESEMHKGMGAVATVLIQNGTLHFGDALVFERHFGRVKTMQNDLGEKLEAAGPSTPVEITGLSGNPSAGDPFIVVKSEKEARSIVEARAVGHQQRALMQKKPASLESIMQKSGSTKKILKLVLRADVQGSLEALKSSIQRIHSEKAQVEIIFMGVGEISESDVELAQASNAVILGFHTAVESHAESLIKEHKVTVKLYDVIYHAIDEVKALMTALLDRIPEEKVTGAALVQATFKASQLGVIAGCIVSEGTISRTHLVKVYRKDEIIWQGKIASLKRNKEDVKEVKKGLECGILLNGFNGVEEGDTLQAYEIIYLTQTL